MNGMTALRVANDEFERRLRLVDAGAWTRATPCTDWDVRALVNHVVGGNRRHRMLLRGASAAAIAPTRTQDQLGDEAVAAFVTTARDLLAEFSRDGALTRRVHHPIGAMSGGELLDLRILDVAVHTWDLACSIGADTTLPPRLVEYALTTAEHLQAGRRSGAFAEPTGLDHGSDQQRLLGLTGRDPARHRST
jgi:uncharacterized protein (TIGR03086 family)